MNQGASSRELRAPEELCASRELGVSRRIGTPREPYSATNTVAAILRRVWLPLVSYYAVTVVIPFANGSGLGDRAFLEHLAVVLLGPPTLVGVFALIYHSGQRAVRFAMHAARLGRSVQRSPYYVPSRDS